jgi:hypothetical protein
MSTPTYDFTAIVTIRGDKLSKYSLHSYTNNNHRFNWYQRQTN